MRKTNTSGLTTELQLESLVEEGKVTGTATITDTGEHSSYITGNFTALEEDQGHSHSGLYKVKGTFHIKRFKSSH